MKESLVLAIPIAVVLVALALLPISEGLACSAGNAPQTNNVRIDATAMTLGALSVVRRLLPDASSWPKSKPLVLDSDRCEGLTPGASVSCSGRRRVSPATPKTPPPRSSSGWAR